MSTKEGAVIVTGGSRGLGRAIASRLAEEGWSVALTYRTNAGAAEETRRLCGERTRAFPLDLADRDAPARLVDEVEAALGPIGALVNNAGFRRDALVAMMPDADWDAVVDGNLGGAFRCSKAVLKGMVSRRSGAIVNVASLSAEKGLAGQAAYAASKAGLLALTRCLAREVGRRGIRVNAVVPGFVATDMTADLPGPAIEMLRSQECLRSGTPAEAVADAVAFLLSPRAAAITGQSLRIDAGASA